MNQHRLLDSFTGFALVMCHDLFTRPSETLNTSSRDVLFERGDTNQSQSSLRTAWLPATRPQHNSRNAANSAMKLGCLDGTRVLALFVTIGKAIVVSRDGWGGWPSISSVVLHCRDIQKHGLSLTPLFCVSWSAQSCRPNRREVGNHLFRPSVRAFVSDPRRSPLTFSLSLGLSLGTHATSDDLILYILANRIQCMYFPDKADGRLFFHGSCESCDVAALVGVSRASMTCVVS